MAVQQQQMQGQTNVTPDTLRMAAPGRQTLAPGATQQTRVFGGGTQLPEEQQLLQIQQMMQQLQHLQNMASNSASTSTVSFGMPSQGGTTIAKAVPSSTPPAPCPPTG